MEGVQTIFSPAQWKTTDHLRFAGRSVITILATFALGIWVPTRLIGSFNSVPAGTVAFLLSGEGKSGSALKKNQDRLVGIAAGSMLGQIIFVFICNEVQPRIGWLGALPIQLGIIVAFEFYSLVMCYGSDVYPYVGLLIACFGAEKILVVCDDSSSDGDKVVYQDLLGQFLGIFMSVVMDTVLGNKQARVLACQSLESFAVEVEGDINALCCGAELVNFHRTAITSTLNTAADQGQEAAKEPSLVLMEWNNRLWTDSMRRLYHIRALVSVMEYAMAEGGCDGGNVRETVAKVLRVPKVNDMTQFLLKRFAGTMLVLNQVASNVTALPPDLIDCGLLKTRDISLGAYLQEALNQINQPERLRSVALALRNDKGTARDDPQVEVGLVLALLEAQAHELTFLENELAHDPAVWKAIQKESRLEESRFEDSRGEDVKDYI